VLWQSVISLMELLSRGRNLDGPLLEMMGYSGADKQKG